jgi:hypothetical protein
MPTPPPDPSPPPPDDVPLRAVTPVEFARRLRQLSEQPDNRYAFFLGAGCSIASGIPSAAELVRDHWLPQLRALRAPDRHDLAAWIQEQFPDYNPKNPALHYGQVVEKLFLHPGEAQREVERLCASPFPSFGYVALACLMALGAREEISPAAPHTPSTASHPSHPPAGHGPNKKSHPPHRHPPADTQSPSNTPGGAFNVVLTTNFDDLVQDALYLFTKTRPLVVGHEALAHFIRPTRTRPLVVKLHGDQRLAPRNTAEETRRLQDDIEAQVRILLHDRGLIFVGYGGHDASVKTMLERLPAEALPLGVYWASDEAPPAELLPWLQARDAIWVKGGGDFDELMLLVCDAFELELPTHRAFEDLFDKYRASFRRLTDRLDADDAPLNEAAAAVKKYFDEHPPHTPPHPRP